MSVLNDKAFKIWIPTNMVFIAIFAIPAGWLQGIVYDFFKEEVSTTIIRIITIMLAIAIMMWQNGRYSRYATNTANHAANYEEVYECEEDIYADLWTAATLLVIAMALLFVPFLIAGFMLSEWSFVSVYESVPTDWLIGYVVILIFTFNFVYLRFFEAVLTIRNCLNRMKEQNPMRVKSDSGAGKPDGTQHLPPN